MTRREALEAAIDSLEAGDNPTQAEWIVLFPDLPTDDDYPRTRMAAGAAVGWLDAAKALHDAVLPGWRAIICTDGNCSLLPCDQKGKTVEHIHADNPARAWLLAILEVLIEQEP